MEIGFLNQLILGLIQGTFEWLPISSSAFLSLFLNKIVGVSNLSEIVRIGLAFHLGTFFAALVYFRKDVRKLIGILFRYRSSKLKHPADRKVLDFLIIVTLISGLLGVIFIELIKLFSSTFTLTGKILGGFIGGMLIITAVIGFITKTRGRKREIHLRNSDGVVLGLAQGLAVLPGISRSGITVSALLLRKFDDTTALRLSFLMSLPIVFVGNILLNLKEFSLASFPIWGMLSAFVFGIATIHGLIKISKKINFNWFILIFGLLMLVSIVF